MKKVFLFLVLVALGVLVARRAVSRHRATPHLHGTPDHWPTVVRNESASAGDSRPRAGAGDAARGRGSEAAGAQKS